MRSTRLALVALSLCLAGAICAGPAAAQARTAAPSAAVAAPARLEVRDDSVPTRVFAAADLAALPHVEVHATEHGRAGTFGGVPLEVVLRRAGVPVDSVRGGRASWYVLAIASDGYRAVFSLAELAPDLSGRSVLLADRRDGQPLAASEGPLRLVVPDDHRPTRWVRQLTTLVVRRGEP
jgi:hypothetical protein